MEKRIQVSFRITAEELAEHDKIWEFINAELRLEGKRPLSYSAMGYQIYKNGLVVLAKALAKFKIEHPDKPPTKKGKKS